MRASATLYLRYSKKPYAKVAFKNSKPIVPQDYEGSFYLRLSQHGKRKWVSYPNLTEALVAQANIETNIDRVRKGIAPIEIPVEHPNKGSIAEAVEEFIEYSEGRVEAWRKGGDNGLSPSSVTAYRKAMQNFAASCQDFGAVHMNEFQNSERGEAILLHFNKWLDQNVRRKPGALKRAKGAYSDARKFTIVGAFLARNGIKMKTDRTFNPNDVGLVDRVDVPRVKKPAIGDVVYYTPEDIQAMLRAADGPAHQNSKTFLADDLKDLVLLLLCTGMRDEEVQHLTWSDINWANGDGKMKITVQDKPQFDWRVKDHEKRIVTPDKNAMLKARLLARQAGRGHRAPRANRELLFSTSRGNPDQNFADRINALQKRAQTGKKPYTFSRPECHIHVVHNFRRCYATYQMVHGVPVRNIQRDLGHSDLQTTERYLAIVDTPEKVRAAYDEIG
jgi:integrase